MRTVETSCSSATIYLAEPRSPESSAVVVLSSAGGRIRCYQQHLIGDVKGTFAVEYIGSALGLSTIKQRKAFDCTPYIP